MQPIGLEESQACEVLGVLICRGLGGGGADGSNPLLSVQRLLLFYRIYPALRCELSHDVDIFIEGVIQTV